MKSSIAKQITFPLRSVTVAAGLLLALTGCHRDMWDQAKYTPMSKSGLFADGAAAQAPVPGTVPYQSPRTDDALHTGLQDGQWVTEYPIQVDEAFVRLGKKAYEVNCAACHGRTGDGQGIVIRRGIAKDAAAVGMKQPPSYHIDRLRHAPPGYFVDVMTRGYGQMYPAASRLTPEERWAIAAYVRTLQYSQFFPADQLTPAQRESLNATVQENTQ